MFDNIKVPTLIIRGGENDWDHPKRTSLEVSCLIKGSKLIDPPWPEDAWERAGEARASGKVKRFNMFDTWVQAAPRDPGIPGRLMSADESARAHVVRMCTSQLSEASSAVWMRLSGMRSRSALRSVTWTTSQPSSPGTRSISPVRPEAGQHAVGVVVGAPADEGQHPGHRLGAECLGAQRDSVALQRPRVRCRPSASRLRGGAAAWRRGCSRSRSMPAGGGQLAEASPCRRLAARR